MAKKVVETPLMRQYMKIKGKYPDAILLFRVGDFYETFSDDAIETASILGITLTKRANGAAQHIELAGFPHHALDTYLPKLVRAGKRVAICDQLEDPKQTKKLVKRGVTELVTPGVSTNEQVLNHRENNFLAAVDLASKERVGLSLLDISTGEFMATEGNAEFIEKLLNNYRPKEVLVENRLRESFDNRFQWSGFIFNLDDWHFAPDNNRERVLRQFAVQSLKGFGLEAMPAAVTAAGAVLNYLDLTRHDKLAHINAPRRLEEDRYVRLDRFTIRSLELIESMNEGGKSLLDILDHCISPMGARRLRQWMLFPLRSLEQIQARQAVVTHFFRFPDERASIAEYLSEIGDLERLVAKAAMGRIGPRELLSLGNSLAAIEPIKQIAMAADEPRLRQLGEKLELCLELRQQLHCQLNPEAPAVLGRGATMASGVSEELDELRRLAYTGKDYLLKMQKEESERTGISSLKIAFNNVFGYYIEVRNTHKDKVPAEWIRKQTLVSAERYITEELKRYEEKILGAEERIASLEEQLFAALVAETQRYVKEIQLNSQLLSTIDCLLSFAEVAKRNRYICPEVNESMCIDIKEGRHPVIEQQLTNEQPYIANDLFLDSKQQQVIIITGPNMSGKSAFLRQTALITLLAQIGSFVPAASAKIGMVDGIFTRVGASDNISMGESTFMVEMQEASNILNSLSERSLVLFDELGRGTSTYDGISIAWAIVEYIHNNERARPRTLFATHYHELNEIASYLERVKNYNVSAREVDGNMLFLRKLEPGGTEHSFGIQVAKLAGMPRTIVDRANGILAQLEQSRSDYELGSQRDDREKEKQRGPKANPPAKVRSKGHENGCQDVIQMSLFQLDDPLLSEIRDALLDIDVNNLTPLEALNKLNDIKKLLKGY